MTFAEKASIHRYCSLCGDACKYRILYASTFFDHFPLRLGDRRREIKETSSFHRVVHYCQMKDSRRVPLWQVSKSLSFEFHSKPKMKIIEEIEGQLVENTFMITRRERTVRNMPYNSIWSIKQTVALVLLSTHSISKETEATLLTVGTCLDAREMDIADCLAYRSNRLLMSDYRFTGLSVCRLFSLSIVLFDWVLSKENTTKRKDKYSASIMTRRFEKWLYAVLYYSKQGEEFPFFLSLSFSLPVIRIRSRIWKIQSVSIRCHPPWIGERWNCVWLLWCIIDGPFTNNDPRRWAIHTISDVLFCEVVFTLIMIWWAFVCLIASSVYSLDLNSENITASTFLIYPPLYLCSNGSFSLEFRQTGQDGLLFYTKDQLTNDSIVIAVDQNRLHLEFIIAKNKSLRRFDHPLNDHRWYQLLVQQHASSSTTEITLSSPAFDYAERQIVPRHLSFSAFHSRSFVFIAGLPSIVSTRLKLIHPSFQGALRNIRYGLRGHARRSQSALFSTSPLLVSSEQSVSLCANSPLDCINGDTTLSSECDCLVKPCHSTSTLIRKWFALWRTGRLLSSLANQQIILLNIFVVDWSRCSSVSRWISRTKTTLTWVLFLSRHPSCVGRMTRNEY